MKRFELTANMAAIIFTRQMPKLKLKSYFDLPENFRRYAIRASLLN